MSDVSEVHSAAARASSATKIYGKGDTLVTALDSVDISFEAGKFSAIMGPSGSGKSTLMHCMAGLDNLSSGKVFIGDTDLTELSEKELTLLRRSNIGFIFQSFNLVPTLNALENITLPIDLSGNKVDTDWVGQITEVVNLSDGLNINRMSYLAVNNNGLLFQELWQANRISFLLMSQQEILIRKQVTKS